MFKFTDAEGIKHLPLRINGKSVQTQCGATVTLDAQTAVMTDEPASDPHCPTCGAKAQARGGLHT